MENRVIEHRHFPLGMDLCGRRGDVSDCPVGIFTVSVTECRVAHMNNSVPN